MNRLRALILCVILMAVAAASITRGQAVASATLADGATLENGELKITVRKGSVGPILQTTPKDGMPVRIVLRVTGANGKAETVSAVELAKKEQSEGVIRFACGGSEAEVALGAGRVFAELRPGKGAHGLIVEVKMRHVVILDFFGDDMVFAPEKLQAPKKYVPSDNMFLGLVEGGDAMVMCVWPTGEQRVDVWADGEGRARRFVSARAVLDGKPFTIAVLSKRGIWHREDLSSKPLDQDIALDWKPPFAAQWRTTIVRGPQASEELGPRVETWEIIPKRKSVNHELIQKRRVWASWVNEEGKASLYLYKDQSPHEFALFYPADRSVPDDEEATPLSIFTPVDIVRDALGVGPCEYILDVAGLSERDLNKGRKRKMHYSFACGCLRAIRREIKKDPIDMKLVEELTEDLLAFMETVRLRVDEYRAWVKTIDGVCDEGKANSRLKTVADKVEADVGELEKHVQSRMHAWKKPKKWKTWSDEMLQAIERKDEKKSARMNSLLTWKAAVGDSIVTKCRMIVKQLRHEALDWAGDDPEAIAFAEKIRSECRTILRAKHHKEGK